MNIGPVNTSAPVAPEQHQRSASGEAGQPQRAASERVPFSPPRTLSPSSPDPGQTPPLAWPRHDLPEHRTKHCLFTARLLQQNNLLHGRLDSLQKMLHAWLSRLGLMGGDA